MLPRMQMLRQIFPPSQRPDPAQALAGELARTGLLDPVGPGQTVLVTAGSRGIECLGEVLAALVAAIKARGAKPVIFPAMGSHGGGTAEGQPQVLEHMGLTEDRLGAPIHRGLEMVQVASVHHGVPVHVDRAAAQADHVILVNRIKEHTEYLGATESGLLKMTVVGLGRHLGALTMHQLAVRIGYERAILTIAQAIYAHTRVLGGVAILEDHHNRLRRLEAVPVADIARDEARLLAESRQTKPALPFDELDILLVDELGKDVSGAGMDTKVIGRIMNIYEKECETPRILRVVVRDLTAKTYGNATGIGLADFITRRAADKVDPRLTAFNCITAAAPEKARLPIVLDSDREAIQAALDTIGLWSPESLRLAWIVNTKDLEYLAVSPALAAEAAGRPDLELVGEPFALAFDAQGLAPFLRGLPPLG
ncbi:MAG: nickel-dependent lactate racemase [Desulfarculus sp.]|nr:nickel-dependent lactate racemase [Desulfarculus sp.]